MKRKGLFAFAIAIFSLCATLGFVNTQDIVSSASADVSVWDGFTMAFEGNDYSISGDNFHIFSANGLAYYSNQVNNGLYANANVILENDIDLNKKEWTPISNTYAHSFNGIFDGQNHTISNLKISSSFDYAGLFGYSTGVIKNVNLKNVDIVSSSNFIGGIVGNSTSVVTDYCISGCSVSGTIKSTSTNPASYVGGIVGDSTVKILNCVSSAKISATNASYTGGIAGMTRPATYSDGENFAVYKNLSFTGTLSGRQYVGGLFGKVSDCVDVLVCDSYSNSTNISCGGSNTCYVGGIIGQVSMRNKDIVFKNVYNASNIVRDNNNYMSGFVGYLSANVSLECAFQVGGNFTNNFANLSGGGNSANFFYYDTNSNFQDENYAVLKTDKEKFSKESYLFYSELDEEYIGFDFDDVWKFNKYAFINNGLPTIKSHDKLLLANTDSALSNGEGLEGEGTVAEPYLIRTAGDLAYVSKEFNKSSTNFSGKYFLLLSDINLTGRAWIPIGTTTSFDGIFDGNGFTVSRISSSLQSSFPNGYGLFGTTNGAVIKNLTVKDADYLTSTDNTGVIIGKILGNSKTYIINCLADDEAIGSGEEHSFVVYGHENANLHPDSEFRNSHLSKRDGDGYEIDVFTTGGDILDANDLDTFAREFKVVVDKNGNVINLKDENYKKSLPTDTTTNSEYYIVKEGFKFSDFDKTNVSTTLTYLAQWEEKSITLTLNYNSYEQTNFGASAKTETSTYNYNKKLNDVWSNLIADVSREGYVPSFYFNAGFNNEIDLSKTVWINDNINTVYVKWTSDNETEISFDVVFKKPETVVYGATTFDLEDAIKNFSLVGSDGLEILYSSFEFDSQNETLTYTYTITTKFSDTINNFINFVVDFENGYSLDECITPEFDNVVYGVLTTKLDENKDKKNIKFFNISDDYTVTYTLRREQKNVSANFQGYFAFAPVVENAKSVRIEFNGNEKYVERNIATADGVDTNLGFDFINGQVISNDVVSGENYDVITGFSIEGTNNVESIYKDEKGNAIAKFKFVKEGNEYIIYQLDLNSGNIIDLVVKFSRDDNKPVEITYYTGASFEIILTTNDEDVRYTSWNTDVEIRGQYYTYNELQDIYVLVTDNSVITKDNYEDFYLNNGTNYVKANRFVDLKMKVLDLGQQDEGSVLQSSKLTYIFKDIIGNLNKDSIQVTEEKTKISLSYDIVEYVTPTDFNSNETYYSKLANRQTGRSQYQVALNVTSQTYQNFYVLRVVGSFVPEIVDKKSLVNTVDGSGSFEFGTKSNNYYEVVNIEFYDKNADELGQTYVTNVNESKDGKESTWTVTYSSSWIADDYDVRIVCEKIVYTVTVETSANAGTLENDNFEVLYDAQNITFEVETTQFEYNFLGWRVKGQSSFLIDESSNQQTAYSYTLARFADLFEYVSGTTLQIEAVYEEKVIDVEISNNIFVAKDLASDVANLDQNVGVSLSCSEDEGVDKLTFALSKANANAYYVVGYRISLALSDESFVPLGVVRNFGTITSANTFDLEINVSSNEYNTFKSYLNEYGLDAGFRPRFVVEAIIAGKTLTATFKARGDNYPKAKIYDVGDIEQDISTDFVVSKQFDVSSSFLTFEIEMEVDETTQIINLDRLYNSRRGYESDGWYYKLSEISNPVKILYNDRLYVEPTFFTSEINTNILIYKDWLPQSYSITVFAETGKVNNQDTVVLQDCVAYNLSASEFENILSGLSFVKNGYDFVELYYQVYNGSTFDQFTFAELVNGVLKISSNDYFEDNSFVGGQDLDLYARWQPGKRTIKVHTNGANVGDFVVEYDYDKRMADFLTEVEEKNLSKTGFVMGDIYYILDGEESQQAVSEYHYFNSESLIYYTEVVESGSCNMEVFVDWVYDDYFTFTTLAGFESTKTLQYNGQNQTIYIGDFFFNDNQPLFETTGFDLTYDTFEISLDSSIEDLFEISSFEIISDFAETSNNTISVVYVSTYRVIVQLSIDDKSEYNNKETVVTFEIPLNVTVEPIDVSVSIDQSAVRLQNLKVILNDLLSQSRKSELVSCQTISEFKTFYSQIDESVSSLSENELYEYIITKYYLQLSANNYLTYRNWNYSDFATFKTENQTYYENIIAKFIDKTDSQNPVDNLLVSYDFVSKTENASLTTNYQNLISINPDFGDLNVESISIYDAYGDVVPNRIYGLRVYLAGESEIATSNYNLIYEDGYYVGVDFKVYVLPQVLTVANANPINESYFKFDQNLSINWSYAKEYETVYDEKYYSIGNGLYLSASLVVSNKGNKDTDTVYRIFDDENILYYTNSKVMYKEGDEFFNYSSFFKILPLESDSYTIKNINNVSTVYFQALYLTLNGYYTYIYDIPTELSQDLIKITTVVYEGGKEYNKDGIATGSYGAFDIISNNSNIVSIITSNAVKYITVAVKDLSLSSQIKFYGWKNNEVYSIDGNMSENASYDLVLDEEYYLGEKTGDEIFVKAGEVDKFDVEEGMYYIKSGNSYVKTTTYNANTIYYKPNYFVNDQITGDDEYFEYYAYYTDLVRIDYVYNFPDNYTSSSPTSDVLKLGQSTIDEFELPSEPGFRLSTLNYKDTQGNYVSYTKLFGETGTSTFTGISSANPHARIYMYPVWEIEPFSYEQEIFSIKESVSRLSEVKATDIVTITNRNESLYTYSYVWYKKEGATYTKVYENPSLRFEYGGIVSDSGTYKLEVVATVVNEFRSFVGEGNISNSFSIEFDVELLAQKIVELSFSGENSVTYNAQDRINQWGILAVYKEYDSELDEYSTDTRFTTIAYSAEGVLRFEITKNLTAVTLMKDAGQYTIEFIFSSDYFICDSDVQTTYQYTISPYEIDLSQKNLNFEKKFNNDDIELSSDLNTELETVNLSFEREAGEDVGQYELYLKQNQDDKLKNYILKYENTVVYQNGVVDTNVSVGTFSITKTGNLILYYEITALTPQEISVSYYEDGYSLTLSNEFVLSIKRGSQIYKSLSLVLFDEDKREIISSTQILQILKNISSDLTPKFFASEIVNTAIESGVYTYNFAYGSEILKRFANVSFEKGYQFVINKNYIDSETLVVDKDFDNSDEIYFDITGTRIFDVENEEIYILGKYENKHASNNVKVSLSLVSENVQSIANYVLSENVVYANISKKQVVASVALKKQSYVYGDVKEGDFDEEIVSFAITSGQDDLTDLLDSNYYTLSFELSNPSSNSNGYLYAGTYQIQANYSFTDFDVTQFVIPNLVIGHMEFDYTLADGTFRRMVGSANINGPYIQTVSVGKTGDELTLQFETGRSDALPVGQYKLELSTFTFANASILVSVNEDNKGLYVISSDESVYFTLQDTSIFSQIYSAEGFEISVDVANKTVEVTSGQDSYSSTFTLKESGSSTEIDYSFVSSISISSFAGELKNSGSYLLNINGVSDRYPNIMFENDYVFTIQKLEIDVSVLSFSKQYDGTALISISEFDEKEEDDEVAIVGRFDDANAGVNKLVSLSLSGQNYSNYALSTLTTSGTITKVDATVSLTKTEFVYGELTVASKLAFSVVAEQEISTYQYSINFTILDAEYSSSDISYLCVGNYEVSMSATSQNYNLIFDEEEIEVVAFVMDVVFEKSGEVSFQFGSANTKQNTFEISYTTPLKEEITLTVTRQSGQNIGYYKALSVVCLNENYDIESVEDKTDGVYRIIRSEETIYLLVTNEQNEILDSVSVEYNAKEYTGIKIREVEGQFKIVFENEVEDFECSLKMYTYSVLTGQYTLIETEIQNLNATLKFVQNSVRNTGGYQYTCESATSTNYQISFTKYGVSNNGFVITKKDLYFKQAELSKVFDNKDAIFTFDDAREVVDGIAEGEEIGISYTFYDDGIVPVFVNNKKHYTVNASLIADPEISASYTLNLTDSNGNDIYGIIDYANIFVTINSRRVTYGNSFELLAPAYEFVIENQNDYDMSRISFELSIKNPVYSSSNNLKVGQYDIDCTYTLSDFRPIFVVDGYEVENYDGDAKLVVGKRKLTLSATTGNLSDVFTKTYDGTTDCEIERNGQKLLSFDGLVSGDDVSIDSASYSSSKIGDTIEMQFTLSGQELDCYEVEIWAYGVIRPVVVNISFDYNAPNLDDIIRTPIGYQNISSVAYPFMSTSSLTTNGYDKATSFEANFPLSLTGREGYSFKTWNMIFENIQQNSAKYEFVMNLIEQSEISFSYEDETLKVNVANDAPTLKFLNGLISEDTNNYFGLYYKQNSNINIVFVADWGVETYRVSISVMDENGNSAEYGQFVLDGETYTDKFTSRDIEYQSSLSFTATAFDHCRFVGLYNNRRLVTSDEDISYYSEGNNIIINIPSVSKNYDIEIRFSVQKVVVVFDLSDYSNSSITNTNFQRSGLVYTWQTDYLTISEVDLSQIGLSRVGYTLESVSANSITANYADFETTYLSDFVLTTQDGERLEFVPNFSAEGVVVNLDYGYDSISLPISVEYEKAYNTSSGWVENPTRIGYDFVGWFDLQGNRVLGTDIVSTTQTHTLTAHWEIGSFDLVVNAQNVKFFDGDTELEIIETSVTYQDTYTFQIVAEDGYLLTNEMIYPSSFTVTLVDSRHANVVVTMPGQNVNFTITAIADENTITFAGNRIAEVKVFDVTSLTQEIVVENMSATVSSGKIIRIVATAIAGYDLSQTLDVSVDYLQIEKSVEDGILTLTVSGIIEDVDFVFYTTEGLNEVGVEFDDASRIEFIAVNNRIETNLTNLTYNVYTGETLDVYVVYKHGYEYDSIITDTGMTATATHDYYSGRDAQKVTLSNISAGSVTITSKLTQFTLNVETVSYDSQGNLVTDSGNTAYVSFENISRVSITKEFLTPVKLKAQAALSYSFAGWSKDKIEIFASNLNEDYIITSNEIIYAIFSAVKFEINFETIDRKITYSEYDDLDKLVIKNTVLTDIGQGFFDDEEMTTAISGISIYYGSSKTVFFKAPVGYNFVGFAIADGQDYRMVGEKDFTYDVDAFTISTMSNFMDVENTNMTIFAVVSAKSLDINISTQIDFEGNLEENTNVGTVKLTNESGDDVNQYGYVDGTRVRYNNFENVDFRNYTISACTGDEVFLKVEIEREGYKFSEVKVSDDSVLFEKVEQTEEYVIYRFVELVGGQNFEIQVLFKPLLNKISLAFVEGEHIVDAGAINIKTEGTNSYKVYTSGIMKPQVEVSAYTDSKFKAFAYISLGYKIDINNVTIIDESELVALQSISVTELSIEDSGYYYVVEFEVEGYLNENEIYIVVQSRKYIVNFIDENETLVTIKNVEFDKAIDLSRDNSANISIFGNGIGYKDEKLNLVFARKNYNYQGFFTLENGAGVRYIDSEGNIVKNWTETGYYRDNLDSKYKISTNTKIDEQTGDFVISLYIYFSYLKTRITFEFTPSLSSVITARDLIDGVDYTNSWYYDAAPNYIEVAFNTKIRINAPEIEGYKFYQFVISQKNAKDEEITDAVTYLNNIPWETNELDNIVEVKVKVVYFAYIHVIVSDGYGSFHVDQEYETSQARALIEQNYIDTTKAFTLTALPDEGYEFVSWYNIESGRRSWAENGVWENIRTDVSSVFILYLKGKDVLVKFTDEDGQLYDHTYGQILQAKIESLDGTRTEILARTISGNTTIVKDSFGVIVGDKVTLTVSITFGFGVIWNRDDIKFNSNSSNRYTFTLDVVGSMAEDDAVVILPEFENTVLSIFALRDFDDREKDRNAVDFDNVNAAGYVYYKNEKTDSIYAERGQDVTIEIKQNPRYEVCQISIKSGELSFDVMEKFEDEKLTLSKEFLDENEIIGVVSLKVMYRRILWENEDGSDGLTGNGEGSAYEINSIEDLIFMMKKVNNGDKNSNGIYYSNASYILMTDLTIDKEFWTPIGTELNAFNGKFNFNGHSVNAIYNAYIYEVINYNGLFGVLGGDAQFIQNSASVWYWYASLAAGIALITTIVVSVVFARKRKKQRDKMEAK